MPADAKSDVKGDAKGDDGKGSADAQAGPGSSVPESSALNTQFDTEEEAPLFRVPRLDDLCVQALAQNLAKFPNLDHIKEEYVAAVVELVDTKSIPFTVASTAMTLRWSGGPTSSSSTACRGGVCTQSNILRSSSSGTILLATGATWSRC